MANVGLQGGCQQVDQGKGDSGFDHNHHSSAEGGNHKTCWDKGGRILVAQGGDEGLVQEVLHNGEEEQQRRGQQGGVPGLRDLG